mmetsp:Transcript_22960/g.73487  ORF Transcript_22960/g.73487 Transcript_22960/m.73487 type:complete len:87 (-) Transcript_22960:1-261(-)
MVTDELVDVLLTPLLQPGSADVVFDTLSYSAGPLPEQQLADTRLEAPVLVLYGEHGAPADTSETRPETPQPDSSETLPRPRSLSRR